MRKWEDSDITVPLKVIDSPYREITKPVLDYVKRIRKDSPRDVVTVFIPEYVVGHWWEQVLHNQSALRLKGRLLFEPGVMVTSVPWQLSSSERLKTLQPQSAPGDARRGFLIESRSAGPAMELDLTAGPPANGGSCVARHDGRVVFVRYALPGERVRARVTSERGGHWHAEAVEVLEAVAGPGRSAVPDRRRRRRGLLRYGVRRTVRRCARAQGRRGGQPAAAAGGGPAECGSGAPSRSVRRATTGWRTRVRLEVGADGRAGFTGTTAPSWSRISLRAAAVRHARRPAGRRCPGGDQLHVVLDDDGRATW